jgi:hypothetical protein
VKEKIFVLPFEKICIFVKSPTRSNSPGVALWKFKKSRLLKHLIKNSTTYSDIKTSKL